MKGIFNMRCAFITVGVDAPYACEAGHVLHIDAKVLGAPMFNKLRCDVPELISGPWYLTISNKPICISDDTDSDIALDKSEDPPEKEENTDD